MKLSLSLLLLFCLLLSPQLKAHSLNDSYLNLASRDNRIEALLQIAVTDLEIAVGVDRNRDTEVTWGEILGASGSIDDYVLSRLALERGRLACTLTPEDYRISQKAGGAYLAIPLRGSCPGIGAELTIDYNLLFDQDSSHRGIVAVDIDGQSSSFVMSPSRREMTLSAGESGFLQTQISFLIEGVWHIWIGIDHILFLLAMLLGVVIHRRKVSSGGIWQDTGVEILKLVTAFTLAHSVTLLLAALNLVRLPAQLVESAIALTVLISGINIIVPIFRDRHWQVAFAFGLIHGFGFANVLGELNLRSSQFVANVLSFNIGVEVGQLIIVLSAIPVLIVITSRRWSQQLSALVSGPVIVQIGVIWLLERSLG